MIPDIPEPDETPLEYLELKEEVVELLEEVQHIPMHDRDRIPMLKMAGYWQD